MTLGDRVTIILKERHLKQVDFADTMGISANYVNALVKGRKKTISETLAKLIEERYGYSAQWVLTGEGDKLAVEGMTSDRAEVLRKVSKMSDSEIHAVLAFVNTLDNMRTTEENDNKDAG